MFRLLQKSIKNYVSDIDKFLAEFKRTHPNSASQHAEISRFERIAKLRDCISPVLSKDTGK